MSIRWRADGRLLCAANVKDNGKKPTSQEVRESIRSDAQRLLGPFYKRAQAKRGLPKNAARVRLD